MDILKPKAGKDCHTFDEHVFNGLFVRTNNHAVLDKCVERSGSKGLVRSLIPSPVTVHGLGGAPSFEKAKPRGNFPFG